MLTFKQIEALYWTVRLGTFSASAQKLHTTQSAITKRIQELEADFDVALFDRSGHREIENYTFRTFEAYAVVTAIYLALSFLIMGGGALLQRRYRPLGGR